jgi:hypothetical protein
MSSFSGLGFFKQGEKRLRRRGGGILQILNSKLQLRQIK